MYILLYYARNSLAYTKNPRWYSLMVTRDTLSGVFRIAATRALGRFGTSSFPPDGFRLRTAADQICANGQNEPFKLDNAGNRAGETNSFLNDRGRSLTVVGDFRLVTAGESGSERSVRDVILVRARPFRYRRVLVKTNGDINR